MFKSMMVASVLGLVAAMGEVGIAAAPDGTASALPSWRQLADTPVGRMISGNLGRLLVLRSEMNVTPEQRAEIRGVLVGHRSQIAATVKSVREKHLVLRDAVLADQPDEGKIRAAARELGIALGDAAVKAAHLRFRAVMMTANSFATDRRMIARTIRATTMATTIEPKATRRSFCRRPMPSTRRPLARRWRRARRSGSCSRARAPPMRPCGTTPTT